ncbi:MAG: DUF262 domain-containing protein [Lentisphaerae bacterium]|nr:DUF262 domain-containing protein [Lentisphaerota bacterium]
MATVCDISTIDLLSENFNFSIPSYQRGYRWTKENIYALLDDLYEFSQSNETIYCLQPIVLKHVDGKLRIIDGQQRLTTIYLILKALKREEKLWGMFYEVEQKDLSELLNEKNTDINSQFRDAALDAVGKYDKNKKEAIADLLTVKREEKKVIFIKYTIDSESKEKEQDIFNRLNDGKIPLTSAELIRALFMTTISAPSFQMEIAKEWELMENTLKDEKYWSIFNTEKRYITTRMDLLFAIASKYDIANTRHNPLCIYHKVEEMLRSSDNKEEKLRSSDNKEEKLINYWKDVRRIFWGMSSVYVDYESYNYMGMLSLFNPDKAREVIKDIGFERNNLKQKVQESFDNSPSPEVLEYKVTDTSELRKFFVLFNILDCNQNKERFRFDLFLREENQQYTDDEKNESYRGGWDVEHIDAKNGTTINEPDRLNNLVLLDARTNRGYKDIPFGKKRDWIRRNFTKNDKQKSDCEFFTLPCTLKVFMKFYSYSQPSDSQSSDYSKWTDADGQAYKTAMFNLFNDFMDITGKDK